MIHISDNFKNQVFHAPDYKTAVGYISSLQWTDYNSETAMEELLMEGVLSVMHASCNADLDCYFALNGEYRVAFFIEGPDGVGKTSVIELFDRSRISHLAEFSSSPCQIGKSETFKPFSQEISDHQSPYTTAMITFANRYWNFEEYLKTAALRNEVIVSDRSWLTAYAYQGQSSKHLQEMIWNMGVEFNNFLISNKILPIYVILDNEPHVSKGDESLDDLSAGSIEHYRNLHDRLKNEGILTITSTSARAASRIQRILLNLDIDGILLEVPEEKPQSLIDRFLRRK